MNQFIMHYSPRQIVCQRISAVVLLTKERPILLEFKIGFWEFYTAYSAGQDKALIFMDRKRRKLMYQKYPKVGSVSINDTFWTEYIDRIRHITLPYTFRKMEETGYFANILSLAAGKKEPHVGPAFSDGLLFETLRGACDFLAAERDVVLEAYVDKLAEAMAAAQAEDGFLCTHTMQNCPNKRWGDHDGDIIVQHDLYNHGCLIEAAVSHYKATGKTNLLLVAVKAANLIVNTMGKSPKKNIVPGHSLPEEAFVKLYRLLRDDASLDDFAKKNCVNREAYLDMAEFWYDARGSHEGRFLSKVMPPYYSQDHLAFSEQTEAVGHSVRAMLCYLGATVVAQEKGREDFLKVLSILWDSVVYKKLHISGGIGARHDIEGFDVDYHLPNKAYLETCAAIGLAFWNTEMNLVSTDAKYFDCFERSLYNNILSAIGSDFKHFFYQNPLESDGSLRRWEWHGCPCCPPMLLKLFSALNSFIYSYDENSVNVNMMIGSSYENQLFSISQWEKNIAIDSKGKKLTVRIRIPEYVENFTLSAKYRVEKGYAVVEDVWEADKPLVLDYDMPIRRICCNPKVEENVGKVAVMCGPYVMCAEGIDNDGNTDIEVAEDPQLTRSGHTVRGKSAQGGEFCLIPYYKWCNRGEGENDARMAVWLRQQNMRDNALLAEEIGERLYKVYV